MTAALSGHGAIVQDRSTTTVQPERYVAATTLGSIGSIHRYPVKSMLGEALDAAVVAERGLSGDRTHALLDVATGKVASAKNPRLWRKLLQCSTTRHADERGVAIRLPGGEVHTDDDPRTNERLSTFLEREVRLLAQVPELAEIERAEPDEVLAHGFNQNVATRVLQLASAAPPDTFVDFAPVHLIASATLEAISCAAGEHIEPLRYRPNVIIATPTLEPFAENLWVGRTLAFGREVKLQVLMATPRCAVPTLSHGDLPAKPEALRTVARLNRVEIQAGFAFPCVGVHARVLAGGRIALGDAVTLID